MPHYAYQGRNTRGELVKGVQEGTSTGAVADQLFNLGITPIDIRETRETSAPAPARRGTAGFFAPRVEILDLMLFCRQMHTLLKSGVPIIRALAGLRESIPNATLALALQALRDSVESGRELSAAMRQQPKVFTAFMVNLVRVGEMTGRLDDVFLRLYEFYAFEKQVREQVRAALRYPAFVIAAMVAALFIVNIFVIPAFAKLFASFKAELPFMTRMLVATSGFFVRYWLVMLALAAGAVVAARLWAQTPNGRYAWDRLKLRLPVVGPLVHKATLARFARSFALASRSGVPIVQALTTVAEVVDNAFVQERLMQMRDGIERGESILRTATAAGVFDSVVLQMIAVGEETGEVDSMMQEIAELYERDVRVEVEALTAKIEPILLIVMGIMVLILALGVFLPMWELANAARGRQ